MPSPRHPLAVVVLAAIALGACGTSKQGEGTTTLPTLPVSVADPTSTAAPAPTEASTTSPPRTAPTGPPGTLPALVDASTTTTAGAAGPSRYVDEPATGALRVGHRGTRVRTLQGQLAALGYVVNADGFFGRGTEAAVRAFQQAQGLNADGIAGPATQARLAELAGTG